MSGESSKQGAKRSKKQIAAIVAAVLRARHSNNFRIQEGTYNLPPDIPSAVDNEGSEDNNSPSTKEASTEKNKGKSKVGESKNNEEKRKPRGRAKLQYLSKGEKLLVDFNHRGQPFGENAAKYASLLGVTARELVPITVDTWKEFADDFKHQLWEHVQNKFVVDECHKKYSLQKISKHWRDHRCKMLKEVQKRGEQIGFKRATKQLKPDNVSLVQWRSFVKKRLVPKYKEISERFKKMRAKQTMLHTMSRKGYARLEDEMIRESETPDAITRGDVWIRGHTRKSGEFLNEEVATAAKKIQEANKSVTDVDKNSVKNDALAKVLGPERRGRVRGLGFGATPSQVSVQTYNREKVIMLEKELEDLKNIVHSLLVGRMGKNANSSPCVSTNHQGSGNLPNDSANHHVNSANHHATSSNLDASFGNPNHNSPKPQGTKCKLLNWTGTKEVVALAEIASTNPQDLVHFVPLGPNHWKVWVLEILVSRINLPRPTREFFLLDDALLSTIAWPIESISFD